jgi:serine phosphatase RsbU (regulator of sigma subunit)
VAIELVGRYTDVIASCRRRKPITAAAEIQQNLLPPRVAQITGAAIAGNVLPSYEVGGDWLDYVENSDGCWLGIADATGAGATAASLGALALGAFRAARRSDASHEEAVAAMHDAIRTMNADGVVTAIIGRWHGPTATFSWINCAHPEPLVITAQGELKQLSMQALPALGAPETREAVSATEVRLGAGDRLILYCDGVTERLAADGQPFGLTGIHAAALRAHSRSAASTVKAIEEAVITASSEPLEDDATLLVLAPTEPGRHGPRP